jgi:hypothetical protein
MAVALNQQQDFIEKLNKIEDMLKKYKGKRRCPASGPAGSTGYNGLSPNRSSKTSGRKLRRYFK